MTNGMGKIDRFEASHVLLIQTEKLAAGGQVIVHDIEDLAVHTLDEPSQDDRFGTVVDVREGYGIRAT
jgi:hypothetical protein